MRIEPLPERLYDAAIRLWQDSGLTRPWNDPEADLRRAAGGDSSCVLAAIADGDGDGDGLLATAMVGHDGHRGWVYYLAVDATQRDRGLGRRMMEACEDWVRSRGIPKIQLMVRATNQVTVGFYEHLGYAGSDVVVLGRRLDG
jgi:ribosomal protein S18 acetylase RimI-like enzyme